MRLVLLGAPGAGKGSLAMLFERKLGIPHVSTGEIFRNEIKRNSPLGRRVNAFVTSGRLVPDSLVVEVMAVRMPSGRAARHGFVLDGFPRTAAQAAGLDRVLKRRREPLTAALQLTSPEALLIRRLSGRRVCSACGANFHLRTMRPKHPGICDHCGGALITRKDDQPTTIRKRLAIDHKESKPLVGYYRTRGLLHLVDGRGRIETVYARAFRLLRTMGWWHDPTTCRRRRAGRSLG